MVRQGVQFALHRAVDHRVADSDLAPPINCGSTLTVVSIFLPKRRSSAALSPSSADSSIGKALVICAALRRPCVLQSVESCRIFGNRPMRSASISTRMKLLPSASSFSPQIDRKSDSFAAPKARIIERGAHARVARDVAREPQHLRPDRRALRSRASANTLRRTVGNVICSAIDAL